MDLLIDAHGGVKAVYGEAIDLKALGRIRISRASHVEPDAQGCWHADLKPAGGPQLGPFACRSEALAAEQSWLESHWLAVESTSRR